MCLNLRVQPPFLRCACGVLVPDGSAQCPSCGREVINPCRKIYQGPCEAIKELNPSSASEHASGSENEDHD